MCVSLCCSLLFVIGFIVRIRTYVCMYIRFDLRRLGAARSARITRASNAGRFLHPGGFDNGTLRIAPWIRDS